jgi:hypothetical protein
MPSGAHRAGTGTSSRGYPRGASSWTTRERIWHAHEPLEDMLSVDQHGAPVPAADAAAAAAAAALRIVPGAPLTAELNPAAAAVAVGTSCDSNGALIEDEPDALALVRTAGRGHPFTLQPLKVWWVDDAGGSRPLVAIGGLTAQLGLWSLYYDIALVAATIGVICVLFGGLSVEVALRSTVPQQRGGRRERRRPQTRLERRRQAAWRCAMWLSICLLTWFTRQAADASIAWCPARMTSTNTTLMERWEGPELDRVHCVTTAGPLDILLWCGKRSMGFRRFSNGN